MATEPEHDKLIKIAEEKGIKVDRRWGMKKLRKKLGL
jgi:hypothetical protein